MAIDLRPTNLEAMWFAGNDGSYRVVLWLESPGADPRSSAALTVAARSGAPDAAGKLSRRRLMTFAADGRAEVRAVSAATRRSIWPSPTTN